MNYTITLSEAQLRVVQKALESYFRVRYKQFSDLADDLAFANFDRKTAKDGEFAERIKRRNAAQEIFNLAGETALPWKEESAQKKTQDCCIAEDIWEVIRHEFWKSEHDNQSDDIMDVCSYPPILISEEKPVRIQRKG